MGDQGFPLLPLWLKDGEGGLLLDKHLGAAEQGSFVYASTWGSQRTGGSQFSDFRDHGPMLVPISVL